LASEQIEEYLEAIGKLEERGERITTSSLARERHVSAPSTTEMLGRLAEQGLVCHPSRGEIALTEEGRSLARKVMRRHRLWERFLHDVLGFRWDSVHDEACKLEHATSPEMEQTLARAVGMNATCPHGHEIPGPEGDLSTEDTIPLIEMAPSQAGRVAKIRDEHPVILREVEKLGLKPGTLVQMTALVPGSCETVLKVDGESRKIPAEVASSISVAAEASEEVRMAVPLSEVPPGQTATVLRFISGRGLMCRCLALGFTPGTPVTMERNSKSGPLIVLVRDSRVALGRGEAEKIQVVQQHPSRGSKNGSS